MTDIESIYVVHKDSPNLSGGLDLSAWKPEQHGTLEELVQYLSEGLVELWKQSNRGSVAAATLPRTHMLKYFWSKRPTSFTIRFTDGTFTHRGIKYPKGAEYSLP